MKTDDLKLKIKNIVKRASKLKNKYINVKNMPVNYACIFSQSEDEYQKLLKVTQKIGKIIKETPTGPLFQIKELETASGVLKLLKIRIFDPTRPELGDADFTVPDFSRFEKKYLSKPNFKIMKKADFYMIELIDDDFDVRAYFSNPPLDKQLNIK